MCLGTWCRGGDEVTAAVSAGAIILFLRRTIKQKSCRWAKPSGRLQNRHTKPCPPPPPSLLPTSVFTARLTSASRYEFSRFSDKHPKDIPSLSSSTTQHIPDPPPSPASSYRSLFTSFQCLLGPSSLWTTNCRPRKHHGG